MSAKSDVWRQEIERRISEYEKIDHSSRAARRLGRADYLCLAALNITLVIGFWIWGGV